MQIKSGSSGLSGDKKNNHYEEVYVVCDGFTRKHKSINTHLWISINTQIHPHINTQTHKYTKQYTNELIKQYTNTYIHKPMKKYINV